MDWESQMKLKTSETSIRDRLQKEFEAISRCNSTFKELNSSLNLFIDQQIKLKYENAEQVKKRTMARLYSVNSRQRTFKKYRS